MKILCIIPARGGSKGIPGKNIVDLAGKPLIAYAICNAKKSKYINRVIVSTDNQKIAQVSENFGAKIIWRGQDLSGDTARSEDVLLHSLKFLEENESYVPQILTFIQCTTPLVLPEDIDGTIKALLDNDADCSFTVSNSHYYLWRKNEEGLAESINHDSNCRQVRQSFEKQYLENGAVYVMNTKGFLEHKQRFFGKKVLYEMPSERSIEIDDYLDYEICRYVMSKSKNRKE